MGEKAPQDAKIWSAFLWPTNKSSHRGRSLATKQWWPRVPFLRVYRPQAPGLKLGLGSGSPTWEGGWRRGNQLPWGQGSCRAASLPQEASLLSSARDRAWVLSSVSRLKDLGLGGEGAGQGEPRRKPVGEEGQSQREGREAKTPIQCKPANEF